MKYSYIILSLIFIIIFTLIFSVYFENNNTHFNINDLFYTKPLYEDDLILNKNNKLYNLGDLLLVPKLYGYSEWINVKEHNEYRETIKTYKNSILANYEDLRTSPNEIIPNFETVQKSIDKYIDKNSKNEKLIQILDFINNKNVLCVHLRTGDFGDIEPNFKKTINELRKEYEHVIIMSGLHYKTEEINNTFLDNINSLFDDNSEETQQNVFVSIEDADFHMAMYRKCKNLLVHRGGFTVLASIAFQGDKLYIDPDIFNAYGVLQNHFDKNKTNIIFVKPNTY